MHIVIRAGGAGTRLWPLSTQQMPKQFYPMIKDESTFELTIRRLAVLLQEQKHQLIISTNAQFLSHAQAQATQTLKTLKGVEHVQPLFIVEPERKDTAAAIGLEAVYAHHADPEAIIASLGSDHVIKYSDTFVGAIRAGAEFVAKHPHHLVEIGIKPSYAETGYGYIEMGVEMEKVGEHQVYKVKQFKEKPARDVAEQFVKAGTFLWNANMFVWKASTILDLFKQFRPDMYARLMRIHDAIGTPREQEVLKTEYHDMEKIAIDYAIIEQAPHMAVIAADIGWTDIGSFAALRDLLVTGDQNLTQAEHLTIDTKRSVIYGTSGKMIATVGLSDMAVIETDKAVLVCPLDRVQEIKKIVEMLEQQKFTQYL